MKILKHCSAFRHEHESYLVIHFCTTWPSKVINLGQILHLKLEGVFYTLIYSGSWRLLRCISSSAFSNYGVWCAGCNTCNKISPQTYCSLLHHSIHYKRILLCISKLTTHVLAHLHFEVPVVPPVSSPWILDEPIRYAVFDSVTNRKNSMVNILQQQPDNPHHAWRWFFLNHACQMSSGISDWPHYFCYCYFAIIHLFSAIIKSNCGSSPLDCCHK